jgi:hypothetical protein
MLYGEDVQGVTTVSAIVIGLTAFFQTKANYKQISYLSRLGMYMTMLVVVYVTFEVFTKVYFLKGARLENDASLKKNSPSSTFMPLPEEDIPVLKPIFSGFFGVLVQASGVYEGIPLLPPLFSNARN